MGGRFFGPKFIKLAAAGFFKGASAAPPAAGSFMVVGASSTNPNIANTPYAAWRSPGGVWSVINTATIGPRALLGVTHAAGAWYAASNNPGGVHCVVAHTADGSPPAAFAVADCGFADRLTAICHNTQFTIASLLGNIISAPTNLSSFTQNPSGGGGSYTIQGIAVNAAATSYVCVGVSSGGDGICQAPDGVTWSSQAVGFSTANDFFVTSNTVLWDGTQFVAAGNNSVATSPDGVTWATETVVSSTVNVITFDAANHIYYLGDQNGSVTQATSIVGLTTATPVVLTPTQSLRCAASIGGITLFGDDGGNVYVSSNEGVSWVTENPGLGPIVLTGASGNT